MSSRFVSAGAIDPTTGEAAAAAAASSTAAERVPTDSSDGRPRKPNSDEWLAVEKELEAERRRREEARKAAAGGGERSLFEVLQANKGMWPFSFLVSGIWCLFYVGGEGEDTGGLMEGLQRPSRLRSRRRIRSGTSSELWMTTRSSFWMR